MGIMCQEGFLGFIQAHIPRSSRHNPNTDSWDTPVKWVRAKPAPAAFIDGGRRWREAESPGRGAQTENQGEDCLVPGCTCPLPLRGTLLCPRGPAGRGFQPVAQASSSHVRTRPSGTLGSSPEHLAYREGDTQAIYKGLLSAGHCYAAVTDTH